MIYDKKYDKFFFIWKIGLISAGVLFVIYYLSVVNPRLWRETEESFNRNKAYTIGIYVGPSPYGKQHYPCYDYYYDGVKHNVEVGTFEGSAPARTKIREHRFGDRFIVAIDTLSPIDSKIYTDLIVPDDIQCAPERGWKEMPNWDQERSKGNTGALWDRSKVQRPEFESSISGTWTVICVVLLPIMLIALRDIIDFFEELPGMLKRLPSYLKNELPRLLAKLFKSALREVKEVIGELKETLVNLPATLKKFWYGDDNH